jgi:hypothetical protein
MTAGHLRPATLARARELAERQLTPAEIASALAVPVTDREREDVLSLVRWFRGRYPTALERLAYVRNAYRRWTRR